MADTQKKFLDADGVAHLWGKISMQDYPNNETLIAVIDAIDETKQNKEDETLTTIDKTIVGAINEINTELHADKGILDIAHGGTGAATPEEALTNFGITVTAEQLNYVPQQSRVEFII